MIYAVLKTELRRIFVMANLRLFANQQIIGGIIQGCEECISLVYNVNVRAIGSSVTPASDDLCATMCMVSVTWCK